MIIPLRELEQDGKRIQVTLDTIKISIGQTMARIRREMEQTFDSAPMQTYVRTGAYFAEKMSDSLLVLRLNLGKLRVAFTQAVAPIAAVFVPLINQAVVALTEVVGAAGQVISALVGGLFDMEDGTKRSALAQEKLGKAVKSTGKAARRSLADFDELQRLNAPTQGKTVSSGSTEPQAFMTVLEPLKEGLRWLTEKLRSLLGLLLAIDMTPLNQALERLKLALAPLTKELFSGLEWAWVNIFVPLAAWTVEDFLPAFLDTLTAALDALNQVIIALKPVGIWLWENFLKPLAEWTGGVILEALGWLREKLEGISKWISENRELVQKIAVAVLAVVAAVTLLNVVAGAFSAIGNAGAGAAGLFGNGLTALLNPMNGTVIAVAALVAALVLLIANWDKVSQTATNVWNTVTRVWGGVTGWFQKSVLQPMKGIINGIIGYINGMISGAVKAVNALIRAINTISFTVPSWVPDIGGKHIGYKLKTVSCPQIPYLAQGAVLPANRPFMAVVGDQKHGTNIEAPLTTIEQAVANVMQDQTNAILAGFEMSIGVQREILSAVLGIDIGDSAIGMAVDRYNAKMAVVRGA